MRPYVRCCCSRQVRSSAATRSQVEPASDDRPMTFPVIQDRPKSATDVDSLRPSLTDGWQPKTCNEKLGDREIRGQVERMFSPSFLNVPSRPCLPDRRSPSTEGHIDRAGLVLAFESNQHTGQVGHASIRR